MTAQPEAPLAQSPEGPALGLTPAPGRRLPGTVIFYCRLPGYDVPLPVHCWTADMARMLLQSAEVLQAAVIMGDGDTLWLDRDPRERKPDNGGDG